MSRTYRALFVLTASVIVILTILRANAFWQNEAYLDDASGNWTALAKDLTEGVFYRPLQSPDGYGGSRYFPLHFVLHAGFMTAIGDPIRSGYAVSALSMVLLMSGVYMLLRKSGAPAVLAVSCATFVLAARPAQESLLAIKGDGLAVALSVWGVALCAGEAVGLGSLVAAVVFFTLAFAAKITAVAGLAGAVLWFWLSGRRRTAAGVLLASGAGMALVAGVIYVGSHGVALDVLRVSASGGATARDILRAPLTLAKQARRVPETLVFIQLGCAAFLLVLFQRKTITDLPMLYFGGVLAVTTVIFGSPGTDTNHLLDLHVASVVLIASWLTVRGLDDFGRAALLVAVLAAGLSLGSGLVNAASEQRRGRFADVLKLIPDTSRPILAQNPLLPVVAGQRAYLLDPFLIRVMAERHAALVEPLWNDFRDQKFAAVVLESDPRDERARSLYRSAILGQRFLEEMERNYEVAGAVGARTVYLPRPR